MRELPACARKVSLRVRGEVIPTVSGSLMKNGRPLVAADKHVIEGAGEVDTQPASHARNLCASS